MFDADTYRIVPGRSVDLYEIPTRDDGGLDKKEGKDRQKELSERLVTLQEVLYASRARGLLVVFQAMHVGGKDSTTRRVFRMLDPAGVYVANFKTPSEDEREHDFLWRIHGQVPRRGLITIFNRSHYEDVVAVRVRRLQPPEVWQARFEHINAFERLLASEGIITLKFFLHVSKDYQRKRLQRRLDRPDKRWKFKLGDLRDREQWDQFMLAYGDAIQRCSTDEAPWYVVPAERRWFRDLVVTQAVVNKLESLELDYPQPNFDPDRIEIP